MKIPAYVAMMMLACTTMAAAQNTPEWELFGGAQYMRFDTTQIQSQINKSTFQFGLAPINLSNHLNLTGWNVTVQQNSNHWFGGVVDFSGNYTTSNNRTIPAVVFQFPVPTVTVNNLIRFYTFMAGPQFTLRKSSRLQPFGRVMFGGAHQRVESSASQNGIPASVVSTNTGFAFGPGGGIDLRVSNHLAIRSTADYIRAYLGEAEPGNHIRVSVGMDFQIESK